MSKNNGAEERENTDLYCSHDAENHICNTENCICSAVFSTAIFSLKHFLCIAYSMASMGILLLLVFVTFKKFRTHFSIFCWGISSSRPLYFILHTDSAFNFFGLYASRLGNTLTFSDKNKLFAPTLASAFKVQTHNSSHLDEKVKL